MEGEKKYNKAAPKEDISLTLSKEAQEKEKQEIAEIRKYIDWYRTDSHIAESNIGITIKDEISCIAYPGGEIAHLLERQLAYTKFGHGNWKAVIGPSAVELRKIILEKITQYKKNEFNDYPE